MQPTPLLLDLAVGLVKQEPGQRRQRLNALGGRGCAPEAAVTLGAQTLCGTSSRDHPCDGLWHDNPKPPAPTAPALMPPPPPPCDMSSFVGFLPGPWTVTPLRFASCGSSLSACLCVWLNGRDPQNPTKTDSRVSEVTQTQKSAKNENGIFGISALRGFRKAITCHDQF